MEPRPYTRFEIAADAAVHALGVGFALIGGPILIGFVAANEASGEMGRAGPIVAVSIYVATLIAMLSMSAGYNLVPFERAKEWLRRLDHSTIYLMIAGAYTPFAAVSLGGALGTSVLVAVWSAAVVGVWLKIAYPRRFEMLSLILYLAMGWAVVIVVGDVAASIEGATMVLIGISGGLYTLGVVFHVWRGLPFQNAIWHVFVLAATAVMYAAMAVEFA